MQRRQFLQMSSILGGGLALGLKSTAASNASKKFGLQLYSLRDVLPADPMGVLKQVSEMGYNFIESYDGPKDLGMFWGMGNKGFNSYLKSLNMSMPSVHTDVYKDFEKKVNETAEIGVDYIIYNYEGPNKTLDDYKRYADDFNKKGEYAKKYGIRFAFHNHDYTFIKQEGEYPQDILLKNTDPALVYFEMDMYWVVTAGLDPIACLDKNPNRYFLCHAKDRIKNSTERTATCTLGTGSIDYAKLLKAAKKRGMKYIYVEQERYDGTTSLQGAADGAKHIKKILK